MSDKTYLGSNTVDFDFGKSLMPVSRVKILVDSEHYYTSGDDTGRTIEKTCPWGSQEMADSVLAALKGVTYIPYTAKTSIIDPSVEVGDGITAGGVYSVVANKNISFNSLLTADVSAPGGDEKDDEYPYITKSERQVKLKEAQTRSYITKTSEEVRIGVESLVDDRMAEIDVQLESITGTVTGIDGRVGQLELTADSLTGRIESAEGDVGQLKLTATSLESSIESANGEISTLKQTAASLTSAIEDPNGSVHTLVEQTARGIRTEISGLDSKYILQSSWNSLTSAFYTGDEVRSEITQSLEKIKLTVTGSLGGKASITLSGAGGGSGTIDLSKIRQAFADDKTNVTIQGGTLTFNGGGITFNSNTFVCNSDNFTVTANGSITAFNATLDHVTFTQHESGTFPAPAQLIHGNVFLFPMSSTSSWSLYGNAGDADMCIATVSKQSQFFSGKQCIVIGWNDNIFLYCGPDNEVRANKSVNSTSDRDQKRDIEDIDDRYLAIMDNISPVRFKYVGQSEPAAFALGYIAQDVEAALGKAGLTRADFAGLSGENGTGCMALSYDDFIPLLHLKINDLEKRLKRLEETA